MSGMEFSDADLMPGEAKSGATEWDDALIKHGIKQADVVGETDDDMHQRAVEIMDSIDPNLFKSVTQLKEEEEDATNETEEQALSRMRARRIEEMMQKKKREIYGQVYHIREQEFIPEVSKAPEDTYVVLHLFAPTEADCNILDKFMQEVAAKHRAVKFCKIRAQEAIHNFPAHKCPTILVYKASHIVKQIEKLGVFGGPKISAKSIEWVLAQPFRVRPAGSDEDVTHHILQTELTSNPVDQANRLIQLKKNRRKGDDSDDDDEDDD